MTAQEWIERFAAEIGADPPTDDEFSAILDLAVACWIGGASGRSLDELQEIAKRIAPSDDG